MKFLLPRHRIGLVASTISIGLALPAQAQDSRSFADLMLRWPEPGREAGAEEKAEEVSIDAGLHAFITPNFEVDTVVAFGINDQTRGVLVKAEFGIRF
ncbi:hypothetical protein P12x_004835 [Tundrisphaera lichenicola]|uniref:hypothetical protein n=1 Tax=Tundrisphaera lichenicola TaxID=2029860 RepID=UPI003EBE5D1E